MFVGRSQELELLEDAYQSVKSRLVIVYGRRRVGKTELLNQFCKGKQHVFVSAKEAPPQSQLASFSRQMFAAGAPAGQYLDSYRTWEDALTDIENLPHQGKKLIVIDEFPYLARADASLPSVLQNTWDHILSQDNIMLVLCGSSMSFMEKEVLSEKSPLYGRASALIKLQQLPYWEAAEFFPGYTPQEKVLAYAVLGGIPHYLLQFDPGRALSENIKCAILRSGAVLYSEPEFLMRQEFREAAVYNSIVQAIALGATRLNEISQKTMISAQKLSVHIRNLIEVGILEREFPVAIGVQERTKGRRGLYRVKDNFFRFWYAFVFTHASALEAHDIEGIWSHVVEPGLNAFAAAPFEEICRAWVLRQNARQELPMYCTEVGRWWNGCEIDVYACDAGARRGLIGECKFKNAPVDMGVLKKLEAKGATLGPEIVGTYLFSKSGFTESLIRLDRPDVHLVDCERLYS